MRYVITESLQTLVTSRSEEEEEEGKKAIPEIGIWEFKDSAKRGIRRRGILHRKTILLFNLIFLLFLGVFPSVLIPSMLSFPCCQFRSKERTNREGRKSRFFCLFREMRGGCDLRDV